MNISHVTSAKDSFPSNPLHVIKHVYQKQIPLVPWNFDRLNRIGSAGNIKKSIKRWMAFKII